MDIFFEQILKNKNTPIIEEEYNPDQHLLLSKYTSKAYYKYSIELLQTLLQKSEYTNKKYIFFMSLHYLLKILYNFKNTPYIDNYDLLILSSFSLGIKSSVDQHKTPFITKLKKIYSEKYLLYPNEVIQKCEIICMKLLDYNINILTSYECLCFLYNKDISKFNLLTKELENIIFNDVNKILFSKPYELAEETINKLNNTLQNIRPPLLITKKTAPFLNTNNKKVANNESSPTTSVSSSYGSCSNTRNNFNTKKLKGLRSQSNLDINDNNIINNINKELNNIYNNKQISMRENSSMNIQNNDSINSKNQKSNIIKKVIYKNSYINKKNNSIKSNDNNNIKLFKNPSNHRIPFNGLHMNTSSNKNITSKNGTNNLQINKFLCFSSKKTPIKANSRINIIDHNLNNDNYIDNENLIINNESSSNLRKAKISNLSETRIFKKPTIDKKKMKTSFKNNKNIKNIINIKKNIVFNTALKNCNIHYSKISDLCKKINFDVFNSISDKDKSDK